MTYCWILRDAQGVKDKIRILELVRRSRDRSYVPTLLKVIVDDAQPKVVRSGAAAALGEIGDHGVLEPIKNAVSAGHLARVEGVWAIGLLAVNGGDDGALAYAMSAMERDPDPIVRRVAITSLDSGPLPQHMRSTVLKGLRRAVHSDSSISVRIQAAAFLLDADSKGMIPLLAEALATWIQACASKSFGPSTYPTTQCPFFCGYWRIGTRRLQRMLGKCSPERWVRCPTPRLQRRLRKAGRWQRRTTRHGRPVGISQTKEMSKALRGVMAP